MTVEREQLAAGTRLGPYEIEGLVGEGGMATVYLARGSRGLVALKVLHPHFAMLPAHVERFAREARAASALHHRHVIEVLDVGADGERPYLVMEYAPGETLADRLARVRRLAAVGMVAVMLPIVSAVSAAHAAGIIHRDLKPDNVILARQEGGGERPVLLDFGISKMLEGPKGRALTQAGQVLGTPYYLSPEQIRTEELDGRTDVYSLGVMLYECATGVRQFQSEQSVFVLMAEILLGQPTAPAQLEPSISAELEAVILRAMAPRREDRFPTADALGRALLPFAGAEVCRHWARAFGVDPDDVEPITGKPAATVEAASVPPSGAPPRAVDPWLMTTPAGAAPASSPPSGAVMRGADLAELSGLSDLTIGELDAFCRVAKARVVAKDGELFAQGATGDTCFAIVRGAVEVSRTVDGAAMALDVLGPETFVGQDALADRATRSVTARAVEETLVIELGRDELRRLLGFHDRVALRLLELIAVSGIRQLRSGTKRLAVLLEARGLGQTREAPEVSETRPLEQLRAAVREWSVRVEEK